MTIKKKVVQNIYNYCVIHEENSESKGKVFFQQPLYIITEREMIVLDCRDVWMLNKV